MSLPRGVTITLSTLWRRAGDLRWPSDHLYIEGPRSEWTASSRCAVIEVDPYEEEPDPIEIDGVILHRALTGTAVTEIVRNMGDDPPSAERFVSSLKYFHEFDSFLDEDHGA